MKAYAALMIFIVPLGVPVLYSVLLVTKRRKINPLPSRATNAEALAERKLHSESIAHLEFLYGMYYPRYYMTEVFEVSWASFHGPRWAIPLLLTRAHSHVY